MTTPEPIFKPDQLDQAASFFETLFDLSFSKYISVTLIRIIYVLAIILAAIGALGIVISAFVSSIWAGLFALVFTPILFVLEVLVARVLVEVFVVIFRIADYLKEIAENTKAE